VNRMVKNYSKPTTCLKDLNYLKNVKERQEISLSKEDRDILLEILEADSKILCSLRIMDYSLLIGIEHDEKKMVNILKQSMKRSLVKKTFKKKLVD
jgi:hypothetical protein